MNCPNCKAIGTLHVYKGSPVYVGCEAPGCHWSQQPLPEFVIEAAIKTHESLQPIRETVRRTMDRVYYDIARDHNGVWCIWRVGFSGRSVVKTLAATDRAQAQVELDAFKASEAA